MSDERRKAIGTILEAGFQMESDAFKALMEVSSAGRLDPLVKEVLRVAGTVEPRPASISRDLVLRAAEHLDISGKNMETDQSGLGTDAVLLKTSNLDSKLSRTLRVSSEPLARSMIFSATSEAVSIR